MIYIRTIKSTPFWPAKFVVIVNIPKMSPVSIPKIARNQKIRSVGFILIDFIMDTITLDSENNWKLQV